MTGGVGELLDQTIEEFRCRFDKFESSMRELRNRVEQIQGGIARLEQHIMLPTRSNTISQPRPEVADHEDHTKRIQGSDTTDDPRLYPQLQKAQKNEIISSGSSSTTTTTSEGPPRTLSRPSSVEQFDVFLSFRGDTRKGFTSYLYDELDRNGVRTFMDSERLEQGGFLMEDLYRAIEASTMAIVVFSNKYADSKWCLEELAKIVECKLLLLPIFYNVEPTEVRNQSGSFRVPFGDHENDFPANQVEGWRQALRLAGERAGFHLMNDANGIEPKLIEKVVGKVVQELDRIRPPPVPPTSELSGKTALSCKKRIVELLQDQGVHKIGVWGTGGVGKTCIVRNVFKELQSGRSAIITNNPFDCIYYVEVAYESDWRDVRKEIKKQVFLRRVVSDEDNDFRAADSLNRRLQGSKFLLILDDLWRSIDLQALGIPEPNRENGCKVLFTTRNYEVCSSMGTQADVKVNPLPWDEAWEFFSQRAGEIPKNVVDLGVDKEITRLCGGIPIGLLEVAEFLRKETNSWFVARDLLRNGNPLNDRMKKQVFDRLRLSYDRLESEVLKDCFLASAFYIVGDGYTITSLARDLVAEGLVWMWEDTGLTPAQNEARHRIMKLQKASLLDETENAAADSVRIEGLMRSMAFQIIGSSKLVYRNFQHLRYAPQQEAWEKAERISLIRTSITTLPPNPSCPNLISLTVRGSKNIRHISDTFFQHMERLCVLDLGSTSITRFPTSLSKLVNLRYLTADYLPLKSIEGVGGLKSLVYLYLNHSAVECLPSEISELSKLRTLDLTNTEHLTEIPKGALCGLSSLESLLIARSAYVWRTKTTGGDAGLQELESLPRLYRSEFIVDTGEDFEHVKRLAAEKWSDFPFLECHVRERNETMEFDNITEAWTIVTDQS